jgi:hypothetical protein
MAGAKGARAVAKSKSAGALASSGKSRKAAETFTGHKDLTPSELEAVKAYQGHQYGPINDFLRERRADIIPEVQKHIPHLESATSKSTINKDIRLYRGIRLDFGVDVHGLVGSTITDKGFASTSLNRKVARNFGELTIEFTAKAGTRGLAVHKANTNAFLMFGIPLKESEVLLPRGSSLKILSVGKRKGGYHAKAELIQ